jgi:hypothetical protein
MTRSTFGPAVPTSGEAWGGERAHVLYARLGLQQREGGGQNGRRRSKVGGTRRGGLLLSPPEHLSSFRVPPPAWFRFLFSLL